MTKVYYNKHCKLCGGRPIQEKNDMKDVPNGAKPDHTFKCMTKCGKIAAKDVVDD